MPTYKDINLLTQKAAVAGTEKLPVSDTEYITPSQITSDFLPKTGGTIDNNKSTILILKSTGNVEECGMAFQRDNLYKAWFGYHDTLGAYIYNNARGRYFLYKDDGSLLFENNAVFHAGNANLPTVDWQAKDITASSFVKSGGTSAQFLKADGSVDSNTYATTTDLANAVGNIETLLAAI